MYHHWPQLKIGDTLQIIAPASKSTQPEADLQAAKHFIESQWQLKVKINPYIYNDDPDFANSDEARFQDLKQALLDDSVQAIWCMRGGYGVIRLLPLLDKIKAPPKPKLFMGFSDITLLHLYFQQRWRWCTLHAPAANQIVQKSVSMDALENLRQVMFGKQREVDQRLQPLNTLAAEKGNLHHSLIGGNLMLIIRTLGTAYEMQDINNKILCLEEVNEPFRKIDGMLTQLRYHFEHRKMFPKAVLLGEFTCNAAERAAVDRALQHFANTIPCPVLQGLLIGHGQQNFPLPLSLVANLTLGKEARLQVVTGVLE